MTAAQLAFSKATLEDARDIAVFHVDMWLLAYGRAAPAEAISALTVEARRKRWTEILSAPNQTLLLKQDDAIAALGHCGAPSHPVFEGRGEIKHIYVRPDLSRRGIGRHLFRAMAATLLEEGYRGVGLGVLAENQPAIRFYDSLGGRILGSYIDAGPIWRSNNLAYAWDDVPADLQ